LGKSLNALALFKKTKSPLVFVVCSLTLLARTGMTMTDVLVLGHYKTSYLTASSLAGIWVSTLAIALAPCLIPYDVVQDILVFCCHLGWLRGRTPDVLLSSLGGG
jgi:hypothetical protein